jgi:hypothetical protein
LQKEEKQRLPINPKNELVEAIRFIDCLTMQKNDFLLLYAQLRENGNTFFSQEPFLWKSPKTILRAASDLVAIV